MADKLYFKCKTDNEFYYLIGLFSSLGFTLDFDAMIIQNQNKFNLNDNEKVVILVLE